MLKVQHGIVNPEAVLNTVSTHYPSLGAQQCQLLALGCHDNYLILGKRRQYVLRLYRHQWWPQADVAEELRFLQILSRRKQPVCKPVLAKAHQLYINVKCVEGTRHAALFEFIPGRPMAHNFGPRHANLIQLGQRLAQIHSIADTLNPAIKRWRMDFDAVLPPLFKQISEVIDHRQKDIVYLKKLAQQMQERVLAQPQHSLDFGLCHGDLHLHNVMLQNDGNLVLFDFDWCGYSWRLYDLATIWWSLPRNDSGKAAWAAVLRGYSKERKLSNRDKKLLPWFVVFRQLEFFNFQLSIRHQFGRAWINDNYYDHHIGFLRKWETNLKA